MSEKIAILLILFISLRKSTLTNFFSDLFGLDHMSPSHWTIPELLSKIPPSDIKKENIIVDPNNFLSKTTKTKILEKMSKLTKKKKIKNILIIINSLNNSFYPSFFSSYKDIIKFSEKIIQKIIPQKKIRDFTILTIYSIYDKQYRIRTGKEARKNLSDLSASNIANYIKSYLKKRSYNYAFDLLYEYIDGCVDGGKGYCDPGWFGRYLVYGVFFVFVFFGFLVFFCSGYDKRKKLKEKLREDFKSIKEIRERNPDQELFIMENCVICLERFGLINQELEKGNCLREIVLGCGHNFHDGCIREWLVDNSKCPICRKVFFLNENEERENLINQDEERQNLLNQNEERQNIINQNQQIQNHQNENLINQDQERQNIINNRHNNIYIRNENDNNNTNNSSSIGGLAGLLYEIQRIRYRNVFSNSEMDDMFFNNVWSWEKYDYTTGGNGVNIGFRDNDAGGTTGSW